MEALITRFRSLPTTIWFVPAMLVLTGLVLGELLVAADRAGLPSLLPAPIQSLLFASGPTGAASMVTTVGTSVFGVAGTAFSITMSVIATASSTYGPRLVRNFMADRGNQVVLGTYGATFVYCLMILRRIHSGDDEIGVGSFVPQLAVNFTLVLALICVALLIYFIHHIATSIEVASLTDTVRDDLVHTIERLYPRERDERAVLSAKVPMNETLRVRATRAGFVAAIYYSSLRQLAVSSGTPIVLLLSPGDHVVPGMPIAHADAMRLKDPDDFVQSLCKLIELRHTRTPEQDIRYSLRRITEMAVRAMSPSTNDPYTAVQAIHELTTGLHELSQRPDPWPGEVAEPGDVVPVLVRVPHTAASLVGESVDQLRPWIIDSPLALNAVIDLCDVLLHVNNAEVSEEVRRQLRALAEQVGSHPPLTTWDKGRLLARIAVLLDRESPADA